LQHFLVADLLCTAIREVQTVKRIALVMALAVPVTACRDALVPPLSAAKAEHSGAYSPTLFPAGFVPAAINRGQMVVGSEPCPECPWPYRRLVRWTAAGGSMPLPTPPDWRDVSIRDLNDLGQIAGVATVEGAIHAVRWEADDTPLVLGPAYYIPGSTINNAGSQTWVEVVGPFSSPTGFDVRVRAGGADTSLGMLPFDRNERSDYFAPFRLKDDGTLVWGYGRWVYSTDHGWRQYAFPPDVISTTSLRDASPTGVVVGVGFAATRSGTYVRQGYLWKGSDGSPSTLERNFLPEFVTATRFMAGHLVYPGASAPPFQEAAVRTQRGTVVRLPVPPPPPNYAYAWGWIFDMSDDEDAAVGSIVYQSTLIPPAPQLGGSLIWRRDATRSEMMPTASLVAPTGVTRGVLRDDLAPAICSTPIAAASEYCAGVATSPRMQRAGAQ
jgi:hypothetical protein